jgi:hypothetical protein
MSLVGTPYQSGLTDCSGIIQIAMKKLGIINVNSFIGSASDIMARLTSNKRKPSEVQS